MVGTVGLVSLQWMSEEREKYIWEDVYRKSWDEVIGRVYLLKAHNMLEKQDYEAALVAFEDALRLLDNDNVDQGCYMCALNDKALVQCHLKQAAAALATIEQALAVVDKVYQNEVMANRGAILVLTGAYAKALETLSVQLTKDPNANNVRFTQGTCLLHLGRYQEAVEAYEEAIAKGANAGDAGLVAARSGQQPNWDEL